MKKFNVILACTLFIGFSLHAQQNSAKKQETVSPTVYPATGNLIMDAATIQNALRSKPVNTAQVMLILKAYNSPVSANGVALNNSIAQYLPVPDTSQKGGIIDWFSGITIAKTGESQNNEGVATGIISPTVFADALGSFIAERFKDELNTAFLERFRDSLTNKLNTPAGRKFGFLFPNTIQLLQHVEPYDYTTYLQTLREDFNADFADMPENFTRMLIAERKNINAANGIQDNITMNWFALYSQAITGILEGDHYLDVLSSIAQSPYNDSLSSNRANAANIQQAFGVFDLALQTYRAKSGNSLQTPERMIMLLAPGSSGDTLRNIFMGLLADRNPQAFKSIFTNGKSLTQLFVSKNPDTTARRIFTNNFFFYARSLFQTTRKLEAFYQQYKQAGSSHDFTDYMQYLAQFETLLDSTMQSNPVLQSTAIPKADYNKARFAVDCIQRMRDAARGKQYGLLLTIALEAADSVLSDAEKPWIKKFTYYGTFMVSIINAQSSTEMQSILESAAMPVGSYRVKRNSKSNICINSYAGGWAGGELLLEQSKGLGGSLAFTAPVGVAFSHGVQAPAQTPNSKSDGASNTLFISMLDVGAVTALRITNDTTALPELTWSNIISPGLYYVRGFKNSPLSLNMGLQYGPALRKIIDGSAVLSKSGIRFGIGLTVDIPLMNIKTVAFDESFGSTEKKANK